jgi:hypothetical protein
MYKKTLKRNLTTKNIVFGSAVLLFLVFFLAIIYHNTSDENFIIESTKEKESKKIEVKDNPSIELEDTPTHKVVEKSTIAKKQDNENIKEDSTTIKENFSVLDPREPIKSGLQLIVKDEAGNLIEKAKVVLTELPIKKTIYSFTTKKDGQAELPEIKYSSFNQIQLIVSHQEFAEKVLNLFSINRFVQNKPLLIVLVKGFSVKGVVRDTNGNFLEGIDIHLKYSKRDYYYDIKELPVIQSRKNGVFEFSHVLPGKICFSGEGKGYLLIESKKYKVPNNEEIILIYQKCREHLIKITDIDGVGIAKASVVCFFEVGSEFISKKTESDEKGFCTLLLTKEINQRLIVMHPEYIKYDTNEIYNLRNTEPANIILVKGNILRGKITDKATSKPIPNANLGVNGLGGQIMQPCKTDSLGIYELKGLSNRECSIRIECSAYNEEDYKVIIEEGKENVKNFELDLLKVCRLKLIDSKSKASIANKKVYNLAYRQLLGEAMETNENGEFNLPFNLDGRQEFYISLLVNGYTHFAQHFSPTEDIIKIELLSSPMLQVFVKGSLGQQLDEMFLECIYEQKAEKKYGRLFPTYNSIDNCFEIFGLPVGKSELTFYFDSLPPILVSVDLLLDVENKINLNLKSPYLLIIKVKSTDNNVIISDLTGKIDTQDERGNGYFEDHLLEFNEEKKYFEYYFDSDYIHSFTLKFSGHLTSNKTDINKDKNGISEYDFVLNRGLGFEGVIMNDNGQKIIDARIEIGPAQKENNYAKSFFIDEYGTMNFYSKSNQKIQNKNGNFFAYGYKIGKYQIKVTHHDYIPIVLEIELSNKSIVDMQILLKKGSQISGTVSSSNGKLAINATMNLCLEVHSKTNEMNNNGANTYFHAATDSKGQFIIKGLSMGTYRMDIISTIGHLENFEIVVYESQDILNLNIKLEDNFEIAGVVVDEKDNPLNRIKVNIKPVENNQDNSDYQVTDVTGAFKFINMHNSKYALNIISSEGYSLDPEITAMGGDKNVKLILKSTKKMLISGHVYLPDGKECGNYSLSYFDTDNNKYGQFVDPKVSSSGFQGSINIENLQTITVIARVKGFSLGESLSLNLLQYSGQPISITLKKEINLEIRVVDLYTRMPINKAELSLYSNPQKFRQDHSDGESDEKGQIILDVGSTGKKTLTIQAKGYVDYSKEIDVAEKNDPIEILMGKGGIIKGQVFDNEKHISSYISIEALPLHGNYVTPETTTDENGNFEIKLVPPGKYYLRTEGVSRIQAIGLIRGIPISIEEGKEINISREEFKSLSKTAKVNISLTGANINKKEISLSYSKPISEGQNIESIALPSNEDGEVSFLNVPIGEFIITVNGFSKPISIPLFITSDQEIKIEIPVE